MQQEQRRTVAMYFVVDVEVVRLDILSRLGSDCIGCHKMRS